MVVVLPNTCLWCVTLLWYPLTILASYLWPSLLCIWLLVLLNHLCHIPWSLLYICFPLHMFMVFTPLSPAWGNWVSMLHFAAQCNICLFDIRKKIKIIKIIKSSNVQTLVEVEINVQTLIEVEVKCPQQTSTYSFGFFCWVKNGIPKWTYLSRKLKMIVFTKLWNQNSFDTKVLKVT